MHIDGTGDKISIFLYIILYIMDYCWLLLFDGASSGGVRYWCGQYWAIFVIQDTKENAEARNENDPNIYLINVPFSHASLACGHSLPCTGAQTSASPACAKHF